MFTLRNPRDLILWYWFSLFFSLSKLTTLFSPSAISLFSSVFHLIRAGLRVAKINGYNQYWILYSTYIKFRLLAVSVYSRILNVCKKLTGKMYSVKGILCSLIYKTYILLHVAKIKSFDRFGKAMFLL